MSQKCSVSPVEPSWVDESKQLSKWMAFISGYYKFLILYKIIVSKADFIFTNYKTQIPHL